MNAVGPVGREAFQAACGNPRSWRISTGAAGSTAARMTWLDDRGKGNAHRLRYESTSPTAATVWHGRSSGDGALVRHRILRCRPSGTTQDSTIGLALDQGTCVFPERVEHASDTGVGGVHRAGLGGSPARGRGPAGGGRPGGTHRAGATAPHPAWLGGGAPAAVQGPARRDCHRTAQRRGDARADAVRVPRALPRSTPRHWPAIAKPSIPAAPRTTRPMRRCCSTWCAPTARSSAPGGRIRSRRASSSCSASTAASS